MRWVISIALVLAAAPQLAIAQEVKGSICVAPALPPNPSPKSLANPAGENRIRQYTIQVDSLAPIAVDSKVATLIPDIPIEGIHWVRVRGDGKLVESFKFKFSNFPSTRLCLFFNELYETWNLWDSKQARSLCKCHD